MEVPHLWNIVLFTYFQSSVLYIYSYHRAPQRSKHIWPSAVSLSQIDLYPSYFLFSARLPVRVRCCQSRQAHYDFQIFQRRSSKPYRTDSLLKRIWEWCAGADECSCSRFWGKELAGKRSTSCAEQHFGGFLDKRLSSWDGENPKMVACS